MTESQLEKHLDRAAHAGRDTEQPGAGDTSFVQAET
jgi:hypothetical protein